VMPNLSAGAIRMRNPNVCYAAEFEDHWYAVAIWSSPPALNRMKRERDDEIMELRRLAINEHAPSNTASRMLAFMARDMARLFPNLIRLSSYQAEEAHTGTIYKASGWKPVARSEFRPWTWSPGRSGSKSTQLPSPKVRWEKRLDREIKT